jgi:hypothetical protein
VNFWFAPTDPIGLHVLRILAGLLFLFWLLPFAGHLDDLFGLHGWFDLQAYREAASTPEGPPQAYSWSILYLCGANPTLLTTVYWVSLAVLALFTLGVATRLTAILTWVIVVSFTANPATAYEGDTLLTVLAFYLMLGHLLMGWRDQHQSWVAYVLGRRDTWFLRGVLTSPSDRLPSVGANVALRLFQVHFAIIAVTSGLHKLQFGDWWAGVALWYPLHPPFTAADKIRPSAVSAEFQMGVLSIAAYAALAWQIGFPLFAWRRYGRPLLLGGAIVGWLATTFLYELPLIGPAIFLACLGYVTAAEWQWLDSWLFGVPVLRRLARPTPTLPDAKTERGARKDAITTLAALRQR